MTREVISHGIEEPKLGTIDVSRYIGADSIAREWHSVWRTQWLLAGLVSDVPTAGDFFCL